MADNSPAPVRLAIIGCGAIAHQHAKCINADPRVQVVAISDPDLEAARLLSSRLEGEAKCISDPDEVIDSPSIDTLLICSPTTTHFRLASRGLRAGKHILCEKPLAASLQEIQQLAALANSTGKRLSVAYQRRYQSLYVTAKAELSQNAESYGSLRQVHLFVCERWAQTIPGTWRNDPKVGSGYFGDAGTHQIDSIFFITDRTAEKVHAKSDRRNLEVEIATQVWAQLSGGAELTANFVGDAHHWREDIHFHCSQADLLLREGSLYRCQENRVREIPCIAEERTPVAGFFDVLCDNAPLPSPASCALPMWTWTDAVMRSIQSGRPEECMKTELG